MNDEFQVDRWVDEQRFGRFNLGLLVWSFLAMLADGYDIAALASAAPQLAHDWHVQPKSFGPAFSASLVGVLLGAPLLGYAGDRYGRRFAILSGCLLYGLATLACVAATNLDQMIVLRFLTGIGIGGLMPNTIALTAESSPRRLRATLIVLMFTGITAGSSLPGTIQAWLIPLHGWPIMFWIGGLAPLAIAAGLWFALPESVKFLSTRPARRADLLATLQRMRPHEPLPEIPFDGTAANDARIDAPRAADARARVHPETPAGGSGLVQLFGDGLAWITPMLWACFATALMANYFLVSWLPLILVDSGLSAKQSGITTSFYHYGGTLGGLLVSLILARAGFAAVAVLFALAIPAIALLGFGGLPPGLLATVVAAAGFSILGAQFGNNAASGLLYPTAVRARGIGWALGIGRFGSMLGPLLGGVLIGMQLPPRQLFLYAAAPMAIGLAASVAVALLCRRRLGSLRLDDRPLPNRAPPTTR